jgi:hypothetical protein
MRIHDGQFPDEGVAPGFARSRARAIIGPDMSMPVISVVSS